MHELTQELLDVDGKIFRSLRLLLTQPRILTQRDVRGPARELRLADPAVSDRERPRLRDRRAVISSVARERRRRRNGIPGEDSRPLRRSNAAENPSATTRTAPRERLAAARDVRARAAVCGARHASFAAAAGTPIRNTCISRLHVHARGFSRLPSTRYSQALVPLPYAAAGPWTSSRSCYMVGYFFVAFQPRLRNDDLGHAVAVVLRRLLYSWH